MYITDIANITEKWRLDRRFYYVRAAPLGVFSCPFLAVMDDFGNLAEVAA